MIPMARRRFDPLIIGTGSEQQGGSQQDDQGDWMVWRLLRFIMPTGHHGRPPGKTWITRTATAQEANRPGCVETTRPDGPRYTSGFARAATISSGMATMSSGS